VLNLFPIIIEGPLFKKIWTVIEIVALLAGI